MTWNKADTNILMYRKQKGANTKIIERDTLDRVQLPGCLTTWFLQHRTIVRLNRVQPLGCLTTDGARQVKPSPHNG